MMGMAMIDSWRPPGHSVNARSENSSMRVGVIRALRGPNVYSHRPVLSMRLYLDDLAGRESREFPGFNEHLLGLLPGLAKHRCCTRREGGFLERLRTGTYFGHVVEHVALELTELAGVPVYHGKTRSAGEPGAYNVIIEYRAEEGRRACCAWRSTLSSR